VRNLGSSPDAVTCRCVLGKDTKCYFQPWGQALYLLWWSSLTKDMQTEQVLCWSGMANTKHDTTSGSIEEEPMLSSPALNFTASVPLRYEIFCLKPRVSRKLTRYSKKFFKSIGQQPIWHGDPKFWNNYYNVVDCIAKKFHFFFYTPRRSKICSKSKKNASLGKRKKQERLRTKTNKQLP